MIIHLDTTRFVWEVFENGEYHFAFRNLRVIDLGCNIGTFSLWIYPMVKEIHAIDKEQKYIDLFNKSIKDNGMNKIKTYTERLTDLAGFMSGHNIPYIDLLKVDIEGDEIPLFENPSFPKDKVNTIIGEYHGTPIKGLLVDMGYLYTEYPDNHFIAQTI